MLSHELRNPLDAIVTRPQLLKVAEPLPASSERLPRDPRSAVACRWPRLLDDLLEASRVTQNKIELRRSTIDLRVALREAADAVRS